LGDHSGRATRADGITSADPKRSAVRPTVAPRPQLERVARWSQANERALAPTTAHIALNQISLASAMASGGHGHKSRSKGPAPH
jgi:hypothetical protein